MLVHKVFCKCCLASKIPKAKNTLGKYLKKKSFKILKNHANDIKQPLTFLINLSFQQGVFPEGLKTARVTPILKKKIPKFLPVTDLHLSQQTFVGLQDVFKTFSTRLQRNNFSSFKMSCKYVLKTS